MLILNYRQTVEDYSPLFLSTDLSYLGICLRPKSSIPDYWSSHRVKERTCGHFEMERENRDKLHKGECVMWAVLLRGYTNATLSRVIPNTDQEGAGGWWRYKLLK